MSSLKRSELFLPPNLLHQTVPNTSLPKPTPTLLHLLLSMSTSINCDRKYALPPFATSQKITPEIRVPGGQGLEFLELGKGGAGLRFESRNCGCKEGPRASRGK